MSSMSTSRQLTPRQKLLLRERVEKYANNLGPVGLSYLSERGIDETTARRWKIGVVPDGEAFAPGRLSIPYLTPSGPVALVFRSLRGDEPKYIAEPGARRGLFGVWSLHKDSDRLVICEGELDTMAVCSLAGIPAVGVGGVNNWKPHFRYVFESFSDVVVAADGDEPGMLLAETVVKQVSQARVVHMPAGFDANSFIVEYGAQAFRDRIEDADA